MTMRRRLLPITQAAGLAVVASIAAGCGNYGPSAAIPVGYENGLLQDSGVYNQLPTGTVSGRVLDERTKMGVPDVFVEIQNVNPPVSARTDASGNFVLQNAPQGKQILVMNKAGYVYMAAQGSVIADVLPNSNVTIAQVYLTPALASQNNAYVSSFGNMTEPYGVSVDNNRGFLYVVDRVGFNSLLDKRSEVKKYNLSGGFVKRFGGSKLGVQNGNTGKFLDLFNHLGWAYGIDVDAGGNLYVADSNEDRVVKFSGEGEYISAFDENIKNNFDVAVYNNGIIGVSSAGTSKVVLFDANLKSLNRDFAGTSSNAAVNGGLRGLAVDNANFVYVLDNSARAGEAVRKYDPNSNQPVLRFGTNQGAGPGQFRGATDLAVDDRNGDVYVVDQGNNRVQRFDRDGRFVSEFGTAGRGNGQFDRPYGIAIDKDGYVYVADTGNKRVQKFAPGRVLTDPTSTSGINYPTN